MGRGRSKGTLVTDHPLGPLVNKACIPCGRKFQVRMHAYKRPSRCPECRFGWDAKPKARDAAYASPEYQRNRQIALAREPFCHWRLPRCTITSTQADHLVAVSRGGDNSLSNLVGSCESCNRRREIQLGNQTRRKKP